MNIIDTLAQARVGSGSGLGGLGLSYATAATYLLCFFAGKPEGAECTSCRTLFVGVLDTSTTSVCVSGIDWWFSYTCMWEYHTEAGLVHAMQSVQES